MTSDPSLIQLGHPTKLPASPETALLERCPRRRRARPIWCGLPRRNSPRCADYRAADFAHIIIDYVPGEWLVESKSLKLYLGSFRNHGAFHEAVHDADCRCAG